MHTQPVVDLVDRLDPTLRRPSRCFLLNRWNSSPSSCPLLLVRGFPATRRATRTRCILDASLGCANKMRRIDGSWKLSTVSGRMILTRPFPRLPPSSLLTPHASPRLSSPAPDPCTLMAVHSRAQSAKGGRDRTPRRMCEVLQASCRGAILLRPRRLSGHIYARRFPSQANTRRATISSSRQEICQLRGLMTEGDNIANAHERSPSDLLWQLFLFVTPHLGGSPGCYTLTQSVNCQAVSFGLDFSLDLCLYLTSVHFRRIRCPRFPITKAYL